jgi:Tol biopolymer transport system component
MPSGRAPHRLTSDPAFEACPAYSANGKLIAYCSSAGSAPGASEIWVMKHDGTDQRQVTHLDAFSNFPDFSPTGQSIAFNTSPSPLTPADIATIGTDGAELRVLTSDPSADRYPAYSPDGRRIAFLSDRTGTFQVWVMDADGSDQRQLTFDAASKDQVPDWSPDGSQIAYVSATRGGPGGDIWIMNADGSDQHPITAGPANLLGAAWSPDGTQIATLDLTTRTVEVLDLQTASLRPVAPLGVQFVPAWQPRGARLH